VLMEKSEAEGYAVPLRTVNDDALDGLDSAV
jgi:hypothetical protein